MENRIQYGPYSPQEVERITVWLRQGGLKFELVRDEQEEKEALMNDGQNLINLADLRTGIYLAQVFYVNLIDPNESEKISFEIRFTEKKEIYLAEKNPEPNEDLLLGESQRRNAFKKRGWATSLSVLLIFQVVIAFYLIVVKES